MTLSHDTRHDQVALAFRAAMRSVVGTCSLITSGQGEERSGLVVTSAISLSMEPPLLLACINRQASSRQVLHSTGRFGLSALGAAHQAVAERFSGRGGLRGAARYDGADWVETSNGVSLLADAPVAFDCTVEEMIDRATHSILIGRVQAVRTNPGQGALIYWNGAYRAMAE